MNETQQELEALLARCAAGDTAAASSVVTRYRSQILGLIRYYLRRCSVGADVDDDDVLQLVYLGFLKNVASGKRMPTDDAHLIAYLGAIARSRTFDLARKHDATERHESAAAKPEVTTQVDDVELNDEVDDLLKGIDERERELLMLRSSGLEWSEVAAKCGGSADYLRRKYWKVVGRIQESLGGGSDDTSND